MCGCLSQVPYLGPGLQPRHVPYWELIQRLFGSQAGAEPTGPHQPGISSYSFSYWLPSFQSKVLSSAFLQGGPSVTTCLSFCLSENVIISDLFFKDSFVGYRFLSRWFLLSTLWIYQHTAFWPLKFMLRNKLIILLRILCM